MATAMDRLAERNAKSFPVPEVKGTMEITPGSDLEKAYAKMLENNVKREDDIFGMLTSQAKIEGISNAIGSGAALVNNLVGSIFQGKMLNLQMSLEQKKFDLAEQVATRSLDLQEMTIGVQEKANTEKVQLAESLAHVQKDLQIELAKIKENARVQIAGKLATTKLFATRFYGAPVARAV